MENQSEIPDLEARTRRLSVYNGEKPVLDKENMPPTGFRDEIEPADETVESMAQVAEVSHQHDEVGEDDDDTVSVSPSMTSTTIAGSKKKRKTTKPKSKRGIVGAHHPLSDHPALTPPPRANRPASKSTSSMVPSPPKNTPETSKTLATTFPSSIASSAPSNASSNPNAWSLNAATSSTST